MTKAKAKKKPILTRRRLDMRVATLLNKKIDAVTLITQQFLSEAVYALLTTGRVYLDGLGSLTIKKSKPRPTATAKGVLYVPYYRVQFRKTKALASAMKTQTVKEYDDGEIRSGRTRRFPREASKSWVPRVWEDP